MNGATKCLFHSLFLWNSKFFCQLNSPAFFQRCHSLKNQIKSNVKIFKKKLPFIDDWCRRCRVSGLWVWAFKETKLKSSNVHQNEKGWNVFNVSVVAGNLKVSLHIRWVKKRNKVRVERKVEPVKITERLGCCETWRAKRELERGRSWKPAAVGQTRRFHGAAGARCRSRGWCRPCTGRPAGRCERGYFPIRQSILRNKVIEIIKHNAQNEFDGNQVKQVQSGYCALQQLSDNNLKLTAAFKS